MAPELPSPSQTIGPLYGFALMFEGSEHLVEPRSPGAIRLEGTLHDGNGPLAYPDGMLEVWHGDLWARSRTDEHGVFRFVVVKPEAATLPTGEPQAPHLNVTVFSRGLLKPAQTRMYFQDEEANARDPVLRLVPAEDRHTLIATTDGDGLRFDIHLQGERETVFFDVDAG
jgi:protocatechuate 3,4-dioxygenase alpha subunit